MHRIYGSLFGRVGIALVVGITGVVWTECATLIAPPRNSFVKRIKRLRETIYMAASVFEGHCTNLAPQKWSAI